jgi:hypothetical protein
MAMITLRLVAVLLLATSVAAAQQPDLRDLARRTWDANLAAYDAGEVSLFAAYRSSQALYHAEPEPSVARFHERLAALEAVAERRAGPARALDLQMVAAVRALVASQERENGSDEGLAAIAAIGSLLALQREQLQAGAGAPEEFFVWSHTLCSAEQRQATPPHPPEPADGDGTFVFDEEDDETIPAWEKAHHERQAWLTDALRAQGRGVGAEYYERSAAPEEPLTVVRGEGIGEFVPGPDLRAEAIDRAAQAGFDAAWAAFREGGVDARAVETWSLRIDEGDGLETLEGILARRRAHLGRMRALEEAARARGERLRLEAALFVAQAEELSRQAQSR